MRFYAYLALLVIAVSSVSHAEDTPELLSIRISQIEQLGTRPIENWPEKDGELFQGLRKTISITIESKDDHLKAIAQIPKKLLAKRKAGKTLEINGWFYTSVDFEGRKAPWLSVIASEKGSKELCFSYTW